LIKLRKGDGNVEIHDAPELVTGSGEVKIEVKATGICGTSQDQKRLKLARRLGADVIVNIQKENADQIISDLTNGYGADVIFECSGNPKVANFGLDMMEKTGIKIILTPIE